MTMTIVMMTAGGWVEGSNENFFMEVSETSLTSQQAARLAAVRNRATTGATRIVLIRQISELLQAESVQLNLFPGRSFEANRTSLVEVKSDSEFTWTGKISERESNVILVKIGDDLTGTVRVDNEMYKVQPLGGGPHVIIRLDTNQFPSEHPEEYEDGALNSDNSLQIQRSAFNKVSPSGDMTILSSNTVIDVLVVYTPSALNAVGSLNAINGLIQTAETETNQSYQFSNINITIDVVYKGKVNYTESGSFAAHLLWFMEDPNVAALRDQHAADVCVLLVNDDEDCGLAAAIKATASTAFCVVHYDCATGNYSFGHEIGHLQGARHHFEEDQSMTPFPNGHGFAYAPGNWRTIMATDGAHVKPCFGSCDRIQKWSSPNVFHQGVATGNPDTRLMCGC